jgi:hypothetical protein
MYPTSGFFSSNETDLSKQKRYLTLPLPYQDKSTRLKKA